MSMREDYLSIDEVAKELGRSRPVVFDRIRRHQITTYRLPPDRRTFVRKSDVAILREAPPPGDPEPIVKKRGGYRGGGRRKQADN